MPQKKQAIGPEYIKIHFDRVIEISRIVSLHYFKYVKDFWGEAEAHDFWELVYVDSGELEILAGEDHFILTQGQCFLHSPFEYHNIISRGSFASAFISGFECLSSDIFLLEHRILDLDDSQRNIIAGLLAEGQKAYQGPFDVMGLPMLTRSNTASYGAEQLVKASLEHLVISLIRERTEAGRSGAQEQTPLRDLIPNQARTQIINSILAALTENLDRELSLDAICQRAAFSRSYLERLFFQEMNCGIKQYFMQMKIERAKELISEQVYTFTEISTMLGFNSIHYFSRTFKKVTGMTPTEYQRSILSRRLL